MPKLIEDNLISALSNLGHSHKLLYRILWEMADPAGVVIFDVETISCAAGITYHDADFDVFGKRVVRMGSTKLLLPTYLITTVKTLSANSPGQNKVWIAIKDHWKATRENLKPMLDAWSEKGVGDLAPKMPDVYIEGHKIPEWLKTHREKLNAASNTLLSGKWSKNLEIQFKDWINKLIRKSREETSRSRCDSSLIETEDVLKLEQQVEDFLNSESKISRQLKEEKAIKVIREAYLKNYRVLYL